MTGLELVVVWLGILIALCTVAYLGYSIKDIFNRMSEKRLGKKLVELPKEELAKQLKDGWSNYVELTEKEVVEYGKQREQRSRLLNRLREYEAKSRTGTVEKDINLLPSTRKSKIGGELQNGFIDFT